LALGFRGVQFMVDWFHGFWVVVSRASWWKSMAEQSFSDLMEARKQKETGKGYIQGTSFLGTTPNDLLPPTRSYFLTLPSPPKYAIKL
jgi:hypothetical protein